MASLLSPASWPSQLPPGGSFSAKFSLPACLLVNSYLSRPVPAAISALALSMPEQAQGGHAGHAPVFSPWKVLLLSSAFFRSESHLLSAVNKRKHPSSHPSLTHPLPLPYFAIAFTGDLTHMLTDCLCVAWERKHNAVATAGFPPKLLGQGVLCCFLCCIVHCQRQRDVAATQTSQPTEPEILTA